MFASSLGRDSVGSPEIRLYLDSGGFAVVSTLGEWITFDRSGARTDGRARVREGRPPEVYLGKATFVEPGTWQFVPARDGEYEAPYVLKGG